MNEENWKQTFNLHIIEYRYANESIVIKVITGRPLVSIWSWLDLVRSRLVRDCGFVGDKTYFIVRRLVGWIDNEFFLIYNIYKNIFLCFLEIVFYVFFNKKKICFRASKGLLDMWAELTKYCLACRSY